MESFVDGNCGWEVFMVDVRLDYSIDGRWGNGAFGAMKVTENRERCCGKGRVLAEVEVDWTKGGFCGRHTRGSHDRQYGERSL